MDLKAVHDRMVADDASQWPDGSTHVAASCQYCASHIGGELSDDKRKGSAVVAGDDKTFAQAEVDAAVAAAVGPLQTRLAELEGAQAGAEVEAKIAAAVEPVQAQVTALQTQLDAATVSVNAEKERADAEQARADGLVAWLDEAAKTQSETAAFDARKEARSAEAKEKGGFDDAFLAAVDPTNAEQTNADRFAAMDDTSWATAVDGWTALRASIPAPKSPVPPAHTALVASAGAAASTSVLAEVAAARIERTVDLRPLANRR